MAYPTVHVVTFTLDEKKKQKGEVNIHVLHFFQFCILSRISLYSIKKPLGIPQIFIWQRSSHWIFSASVSSSLFKVFTKQ